MTTIKGWRLFFLVSLGIVTPLCSAEFYPPHIHQISAMYTDPDRILQELDVYQRRSDIRLDVTVRYVLAIPANCRTRDTIDQELGVPDDRASLAPMAYLRAEL